MSEKINQKPNPLIYTRKIINKCPCGKSVEVKSYLEVQETETFSEAWKRSESTFFAGLCDCGNVFIVK